MLQIVGLTYQEFRASLVKKLGPNGERKVAILETSVEVVRILVTEGFLGIWQKRCRIIEGFKQTVIGGIQDFVITSVIRAGIGWLAGLSNPVGAVVKVVLSIYNMVVAFIERIKQIIEVAHSIFNSIGAIARGQIEQATDFVEQTIGRTMPVVITFLAALIPVTGITNSIRTIVKKLRPGRKGARETGRLRCEKSEEAVLRADRQAQRRNEAALRQLHHRQDPAPDLCQEEAQGRGDLCQVEKEQKAKRPPTG